jgi:hypothetical protein
MTSSVHRYCGGAFAVAVAALGLLTVAAAAAEPPRTITELLLQGWEIGGYTSTADNRSALIGQCASMMSA